MQNALLAKNLATSAIQTRVDAYARPTLWAWPARAAAWGRGATTRTKGARAAGATQRDPSRTNATWRRGRVVAWKVSRATSAISAARATTTSPIVGLAIVILGGRYPISATAQATASVTKRAHVSAKITSRARSAARVSQELLASLMNFPRAARVASVSAEQTTASRRTTRGVKYVHQITIYYQFQN